MTDKATDLNSNTSRRTLLKSVPAIASAAVVLGALTKPQSAVAQTKLTHQVAKYQDTPHDGQECSTCVNFLPPDACRIVASPISPHGWCQFYAKKT